MSVREVSPTDRAEWLRMRSTLWEGDHADEIDAFFAESDPTLVTLVWDRGDGRLGGFLEAGQRDYAEGCDTSPVAFIEGWYVDADLRRQGVGAALVRATEAWAVARGFSEIASDTEVSNTGSQAAHAALGYTEVERIVCFRKDLTPPTQS